MGDQPPVARSGIAISDDLAELIPALEDAVGEE
jgi:hypothetical protein